MESVFVININSESGDYYGPYVVKHKPPRNILKTWLKKNFPCEFEDEDGPGIFGSCLFVKISEVDVTETLM